jgi:hypothetical protein
MPLKKAAKKTAVKKKAAALNHNLAEWRAICMECAYRSKRRFDSADEAIDYGIAKHGDPKGHEIDAERG